MDAIVIKGDFYRDDVERTQRLRSEGRRKGRLRRKSTLALISFGFLILLLVAAPSILCQSPLAKSLIRSALAGYGFDGGVESVRVGWITPLRVDGLELTGRKAGSHLSVERIDTAINLLQCMRGLSDLGELSIRGVVAEVTVSEGTSSIEQDLAVLLESQEHEANDAVDNSAARWLTGSISVQAVAVRISDTVTKADWIADQAKAEVGLSGEMADATFSAVLTDPMGGSGELEGRIQYPMQPANPYRLELVTQRIPLSLASLAKRWLGEAGSAIPDRISGDATGSVTVSGGVDDAISVTVSPMEFRNFIASDPSLGDRVWRNGLTTIRGSATVDGDRIIGRNVHLATDFGSVSFNGAFNSSISLAGESNPAAWLEALDGSAGATVDLVAFERALPGLIPLREQAEIASGSISAEITSAIEAGSVRRSHWNLKSQPIRAVAAGRSVTIEPATLVASLRVAEGQLAAETIRLQSAFANANVEGDLSRGRVTGDIQFSRLASMIQPLLDMPELSLAGQASGEMSWAAEADNLWRLGGRSDATDLVISLPGGINIQQPTLNSQVNATGRWADGSLSELSLLSVTLATPGIEATADLTAMVYRPATTPLPLKITSRGRLESLASLLGPWMPASVNQLQGGYMADAVAAVTLDRGEVTHARLQVEEPRLGYGEQLFAQAQLVVDFDGRYAWPEGTLDTNKMTVVGDALSAAVQGTMNSDGMNVEVAWRAKADRLQDAMRTNIAASSVSNTLPVNFRAAPAASPESYRFAGDCDGRLTLRQEKSSSVLAMDSHITANNFKVISLTGTPGPPPKPVWEERLVNLDTALRYDLSDGKIEADKVQVATDWIASTFSGKALWNEAIGDVAMRGVARVKMPEVAMHLSRMLGTTVQLTGLHETPVEISATRNGTEPVVLAVKANLGWESGSVAGIAFGPTSIPLEMNETTVSVKPASIPVERGRLQLAGDLHYSPGPMWMSVAPGVVAEDLQLTPELTNQWLQYLAPMVANSTRVEGTFGIELAEAIVNLDQPMASKVRGSLRITGVNLDSGPVANQIIGSIKQIQQLVRGLNAEPTPQKDKRLVTFPTQSVDFEFANGVVSHQRMFMEIDRARIITSGQVHADGRMSLIAQVPLDPSWLGSDLKGLAGQSVTLPIDGTLSRPSLDSAGIRKLVAELGTKALQSTAESYIEKQLGKGFEKLLGR